jgi:intron-binding protein aquarius
VVYCRGCEVYEVLDESKHVVDDRAPIESRRGHVRTFRVWLDSAQYQQDIIAMKEKGAEDPYKTFNLLMRRKPKENNFKSILETIRDLMNTKAVVPSWLHDVFLGYGDPAAAQPQHNEAHTLDYNDVFLSRQHLTESFPGWVRYTHIFSLAPNSFLTQYRP